MKIRSILTLFLLAASSCAFSQVLYSSTTEFGSRFNIGVGSAGTPKIAFDDISIPNTVPGSADSIAVTKVKLGVRRAPGAPAVDVKIYYAPLDDTSTGLNNYIKIPPVLLGTVSLPANPSSLVTTIISVGDSISPLFKMKSDTSAVFPGYKTFFIGASFSDPNEANGLRATTGPKVNSNHIWIYNPDSTAQRYEGHFDNADATFYVQVFGGIQSTLPVTLSKFTGLEKDGANVLNWTTETELSNGGFEIQRSADGINFNSIGFVDSRAAGGISTSKLSYAYTDRNCLEANNYYRLKQLDKDGTTTFSKVVLLKAGAVSPLKLTAVYPNPATSVLNLAISSDRDRKISIVVTDFSGGIIIRQAGSVVKGSTTVSLNVLKVGAGSYIVKVIDENNATVIGKFVKQ